MELKTYLSARPCASLSQIARRLAVDPETVRPMLQRWIDKGRVRHSRAARCKGCASCGEADLEFFEWVGSPGDERAS